MTNKEKYIQLCNTKSIPVHSQYWWYEKATQESDWDAIVIDNAHGDILAAMPYWICRKYEFRLMIMPRHTQFLWIYVSENAPKNIYETLLLEIDKTCRLNNVSWCSLMGYFPSELLNEAQKHKFEITQRISYQIEKVPASEHIIDLFSSNKKRQIKKNHDGELCRISVDEFYSFHSHCLAQRGKKIDYDRSWAISLLSEAVRRNSGCALAVKNSLGQLMSAVFLIWDEKVCYYLLPTYDNDFKHSGAMAFVTYKAMEFASENNIKFDFEGSMQPSIASSYMQFGGKACTYYKLDYFRNPLLKILLKLFHHI